MWQAITARKSSISKQTSQEIFDKETGSIIDSITPLTLLFLGQMKLKLDLQ